MSLSKKAGLFFASAVLVFCFAAAGMFFSCDNSSSDPIPIALKKTSDWLFLFYYDADDDVLNDDIYGNMRDIECALCSMRNPDGSPKAGYPSVTALVLWDGVDNAHKGPQKYIHSDGALYELGPDYNLAYIGLTEENHYNVGVTVLKGRTDLGDKFVMGPNTIDWTAMARASGLLEKEPNMASGKTLENFLKWAKARYDAPNVVLCLSDHGSGPYNETGAGVSGNSTHVGASLCTDVTNGNDKMLNCKSVKDALAAAGYKGDQKPKVLWNDVCLQSNAEVLWNYAGCADYFVTSADISFSQDMVRIFTSFFKGMTPRDFGKIVVSAYHQRYHANPIDCPKDEATAIVKRASGYSVYTNTFLSLDETKAVNLRNAVDAFADALLTLKAGDENAFKKAYGNYVDQDPRNYAGCKGLAYRGVYAHLSDLGCLALDVKNDPSLASVHAAADALLTLLKHDDDNLIVYAWGGRRAYEENNPIDGKWKSASPNQLYLTGGVDYISGKTITVDRTEDVFGLTIVGCSVYAAPDEADYDVVRNYNEWTGFSSKWGQVINAWFAFY